MKWIGYLWLTGKVNQFARPCLVDHAWLTYTWRMLQTQPSRELLKLHIRSARKVLSLQEPVFQASLLPKTHFLRTSVSPKPFSPKSSFPKTVLLENHFFPKLVVLSLLQFLVNLICACNESIDLSVEYLKYQNCWLHINLSSVVGTNIQNIPN